MVLFAAHVFAPSGRGLLLGFLPWDLAYPLAWIVFATAAVFYMTNRAWRDVDEADPTPLGPNPRAGSGGDRV